MTNNFLFQLLKCKDLLLFLIILDSNTDTFGDFDCCSLKKKNKEFEDLTLNPGKLGIFQLFIDKTINEENL